MGCCVNNLGRYSHNEIVDTYVMVPIDGLYKAYMTAANGNTFVLNKELDAGQTLKFDIGELNESMLYDFTIQKPDGTNIVVNACETFRLQTIINTQIDGCNPCSTDADSGNYYGY